MNCLWRSVKGRPPPPTTPPSSCPTGLFAIQQLPFDSDKIYMGAAATNPIVSRHGLRRAGAVAR
ncbi:hypothetical protein M9458_037243, partial [Cirrhinus mrigala]